MALAMPDISEAKSLPRHVERCGQRFKLLARGQAGLGRTQLVILAMGLYLVVVSEPARNLLKLFGIHI